MTVQNFFVLTSAQRDTVMGWNSENCEIAPRAINNGSPGVGINLNDNATGYDPGDPVTLSNCFVAPKRIVDDTEFLTHAPVMVTFLLTLPWCTLEPEMIFAPPELE